MRVCALDAAAGIFGLSGRFDVAVRGREVSLEAGVWFDGAAGVCVEGHGVCTLFVHALEDVDFTVFGPFGADEPESRPDAANSSRHVDYVRHEEAVVEGFFGREPSAGAAGCELLLAVDAKVGGIAQVWVYADKSLCYCGVDTGVFNEALGRVLVGEEVKGFDQVFSEVVGS